METKTRALFDEALRLRDTGEIAESMKRLEEIVDGFPKDHDERLIAAHSCAQLAGLHSDRGDQDACERWFRRALQIGPGFELASVGLFTTLWETERRIEALDELVRFLEKKDSPEYRRMLGGDGFRDDLSPAERALAEQGRALLAKHASKT